MKNTNQRSTKKITLYILCIFFYLLSALVANKAKAQNVGINATGLNPDVSAILDIDSGNKGLLIPRVSLNDISDVTTITTPATSLLVYNTNSAITGGSGKGYYYYNGSNWIKLIDGSSTNAWNLTGNSGTDSTLNFVGTTDYKPLIFKTNSSNRMILSSKGFLGLNLLSPRYNVHVKGDSGVVFENRTLATGTYYASSFVGSTALFCPPGIFTFIIHPKTRNYLVYKAASNSLRIGAFDTLSNNNLLAANSIALGYTPNAGINAIAMGYVPTASGTGSVAIGSFTVATGSNSLSLMGGNASALNAISIGKSVVSDTGAISLGTNDVLKDNAIGIGQNNAVNGKYSVCIGNTVGSIADNAFVIGMGTYSSASYGGCGKHLYNRISKSLVVGFDSDSATFFVGPSAGEGTTGSVGIGNTVPAFKLDVTGGIRSGGPGTDGKFVLFSEQGATDYSYTINPNALATQNVNLTLPTDDGNASQVLTTDGSGNLSWTTVSVAPSGWSLTGNTTTNDPASPATYGTSTIAAGENYVGTTDAQDLVFATNTIERLRVKQSTGYVGIGIAAPTEPLQVYKVSDNNKSVIYSYASQFSTSTDFQNRAITGIAKGGSTLWGYSIGVAGVADKNNSYYSTGVYAGLGASAPSNIANDQALYADGANLGYSAILLNGNAGIGTTTPNSTLEVNGAMAMKVKTSQVAGTNNPDNTGEIWLYTSGTGVITLPGAATCPNRMYVLLNNTAAIRTISSYKDLTGAAQTTIGNNVSLWIVSDGASWQQIK